MPTDLDQLMNAIADGITAPGQMFETVPFERDGITTQAFKQVPPSLAHFFAYFCNQHKDAPFLVDGETRMTFGEVYGAARTVAAGLIARHDVKKGDRIGIAARNSANWAIAYMGVIMAGGCATLLNGFWEGEELAYGVELAGCSLVLADSARAKRLDGTEHSAKVVTFDHGGDPAQGLGAIWPQDEAQGAHRFAGAWPG